MDPADGSVVETAEEEVERQTNANRPLQMLWPIILMRSHNGSGL